MQSCAELTYQVRLFLPHHLGSMVNKNGWDQNTTLNLLPRSITKAVPSPLKALES